MPPTSQLKPGDTERDTLDELVECKCIALSGARIESVDEDQKDSADGICQNPSEIVGVKLTVLNLSGQELKSLPENVDLANVNVLNLSNNTFSELPSNLESARFLRVLNVSSNKLVEFPKVLTKGLHILKELNLSHNPIKTLKRPKCYQHLTELKARDCDISEFPLWILQEMHFLEVLDLALNPLFLKTAISAKQTFHQSCNNLQRVNFSNTYLTDSYLPIVSHFKQLQYLDISNYSHKFTNSISAFCDNLPVGLKVLKAINVRLVEKVNLRETRVEKVNLSHNSLVIMKEVDVAVHIRFLVLSDCYVTSLPDNFGDMVHLVYLNLSHNDLDALPASFANLTELVHLDLYRNYLREFPAAQLLPLKKITCFDMCMNPIDVPPYPLGEDFPSYERLRAKLRSALTTNLPRQSGKVKPSPSESSDESGQRRHYSSSEEDSNEDDDYWEAMNANSSPPSRPAEVVEEEDWDDVDPVWTLNDATTSLPTGGLNRTEDWPNDEDSFQMQLRLVPARIRNSGLFYYRAAYAVLPPLYSGRSAEPEPIVEGQFDDE